jgi:5'-3' exonuclease
MIIIDFSAIAIGNIIAQKLTKEEDIRHTILNSLRMYNKKFRNEYGQMVIAIDSYSWRKEIYPEYKFKRASVREKSPIDWKSVFLIINKIKLDLKENFPYKIIEVARCEADDIIGVLAFDTQEFGQHDKVMIVSGDKDFIQLHQFNNIRQYSPITKKFIQSSDPKAYLLEHLLKGDSSDGVPNVLSPDNTFSESIRQSPMTKKKMAKYTIDNLDDMHNIMEPEIYRNFCRNRKLIDLTQIPKDLVTNIQEEIANVKVSSKLKVLNYLIKNRCSLLIECAGEFT